MNKVRALWGAGWLEQGHPGDAHRKMCVIAERLRSEMNSALIQIAGEGQRRKKNGNS